MSKLKNKVALVTGASKGIGAAIAKALAAEGASVVVNYASSKAGADAVVNDIVKAGGKAVAVQGDVSKAADAQAIVDAAIKHYGRLDVLVNNSGIYEFAPIEAITEEHYDKQFNVNVRGLLLVTQAAVKHLGEGASIINLGSLVSRIVPENTVVYTATKGAVDAITGVLSKELGPRKIRVNALNPGMVETEGTHAVGAIGGDFEKYALAATPLGRIGQPNDIASIAVFLASDDSYWLTGERLYAGGGVQTLIRCISFKRTAWRCAFSLPTADARCRRQCQGRYAGIVHQAPASLAAGVLWPIHLRGCFHAAWR